ncbi:MAG: GDSL-type esterase/lipase family protein [Clostridiales bacterium]|nr:GDSL-type esterase/lipase family protein [Clostridiales bacterium]
MAEYTQEQYNQLVDEIQKIDFAEIKLENECEERVCGDLNLWDGRNTKFGYADVSWTSSKPDSISTSGAVICGPEKIEVTVTAHFSYQDYPEISIDKDFILTVLSGSGVRQEKSEKRLDRRGRHVVFVIGDSTASPYPHSGENNRFPQTGWAQYFDKFFDHDKAVAVDIAMSGRSAKSYMTEDNFKFFKENISEGDYLILQFGHNDSKIQDQNRYASAKGSIEEEGSYKNLMSVYINIARDAGAVPIIATSISRRKLSDESLEEYVNAAKELGEELGVPVLDIYRRTNDWINEVGLEEAKSMYKIIKPHDERFTYNPEFLNSQFYECGDSDDTHLNIFGADRVANWVLDEIRIKVPELCKLII